MTQVTYDADTPVGLVRFYIDDKVAGAGPFPNGANFTNKEIENQLALKAGNINEVVVICLDVLANAWAKKAIAESDEDLSLDAKNVSKRYQEQANNYKESPIDSPASRYGSVALVRSDHWTSDESEYA